MHSGVVIEAARKALHLTQKQLGELAGVDHTTVSRIERGVYSAPPRTVKALTDALGQAKAVADRGAA
jgi:transcriptional regulator with XRE-family HTH domain